MFKIKAMSLRAKRSNPGIATSPSAPRNDIWLCTIVALLFFCLMATPAMAKKKNVLPSEQAVFHNNRGISYLSQGDLERAIFEFQTASELAPEFAEPLSNLGLIYKIQGKNDQAISWFLQAAGKSKTYASPHNHLAATYLAMGRLEDAMTQAKKAIKMDPLMADAHYNLGLIWLEKDQREHNSKYVSAAEKEFKKTTELNPNLEPVHLRLAAMYREQGKYDLAIVRYRLALGISNSADVWETLGNLYLEIGDPFKAQNCFQKAIEVRPDSEAAHIQLGTFYLNQKRFDEALAEFQAAVDINPKNETAWFRLGTLKMDQGEYAEALEFLQKAKRINPNYSDAVYNLGIVELKLGKTDQAKADWEYVLTIDPACARAQYNLALLSAQSGNMKEAGKYYCGFLQNAKGGFPAEEGLARKFVGDKGIKCQN